MRRLTVQRRQDQGTSLPPSRAEAQGAQPSKDRPGRPSAPSGAVVGPSQGVSCDHIWCGRSAWRFAGHGSSTASTVEHDECERPKWLACVLCGEVMQVRCKSARASRCMPCSERHRRAVATVMREGAASKAIGSLFFVTLTAPGADRLPWDRSKCSHAAAVTCSGELGCRVQVGAAAAWNASAPKRWSYFRQFLQRSLGLEVALVGSWETQERGMLHRHVLVRVEGVVSQRRFDVAVRSYAARYEFGRKRDVQLLSDPVRSAWYLAKYATKAGDDRATTPFLDRASGDLFGGRYRSWSASRNWGVTMASVWAAQRRWAAGGGVAGAAAPNAGAGAGAVGAGLDFNTESSTRGFSAPWVPVLPVLS